MRRILPTSLVVLALAASACASNTAPGSSPDAEAGATAAEGRAPHRRSSSVMLDEEIVAARQGNLYDVIRNRRPRWLRTRTVGTGGRVERIDVLINNVPSSLNDLRALDPDAVARVEFRSSFDASRAGASDQMTAGTIVVTLH